MTDDDSPFAKPSIGDGYPLDRDEKQVVADELAKRGSSSQPATTDHEQPAKEFDHG